MDWLFSSRCCNGSRSTNPLPQIRNQRTPRQLRCAPNMLRLRNESEDHRGRPLRAAAIITVAATLAVCLTIAPSSRARSQVQNTVATPLKFEYEVATIKPNNPESKDGVLTGMN